MKPIAKIVSCVCLVLCQSANAADIIAAYTWTGVTFSQGSTFSGSATLDLTTGQTLKVSGTFHSGKGKVQFWAPTATITPGCSTGCPIPASSIFFGMAPGGWPRVGTANVRFDFNPLTGAIYQGTSNYNYAPFNGTPYSAAESIAGLGTVTMTQTMAAVPGPGTLAWKQPGLFALAGGNRLVLATTIPGIGISAE